MEITARSVVAFLRPGQTDATSSNIVESNIVGQCCTVLDEVAKRMQHVGFNVWAREVWVQNLSRIRKTNARHIKQMARDRSTVKRCLAALAPLEMLEEEDDRVTKRGLDTD